MEEEKRIFKRGNEWWQAVRSLTFFGPGTAKEAPEANQYSIDFTRLDSNRNPDPNHKIVTALCGIPWNEITPSQLEGLLNRELEE